MRFGTINGEAVKRGRLDIHGPVVHLTYAPRGERRRTLVIDRLRQVDYMRKVDADAGRLVLWYDDERVVVGGLGADDATKAGRALASAVGATLIRPPAAPKLVPHSLAARR